MEQTLIDFFPSWKTSGGIFSAMAGIDGYTPPWSESDIDASLLDILYFGNHSGLKNTSVMVDSLLTWTDEIPSLSADDIEILAKVVIGKYGIKWNKLYATMTAEYNPIHNYEMSESSSDDEKNTGTTGNVESTQYGHLVTGHGTGAQGQDDKVFGFNSAAGVNSAAKTATNSADTTEQNSGTDTNSSTRTDNLDKAITHTLSRAGNIGVTTTQQMLESERNLWFWDYFNVVFADVDTILTTPLY